MVRQHAPDGPVVCNCLENPRLAEDLDTFARRLLTPLLEYDAANSSHLTDTFVVYRFGSAVVSSNSTQCAAAEMPGLSG